MHPLAPVRGLAERAVPHGAQRAARAARAARRQRAAAALARALPARRPDLGLRRARAARVGAAACARRSTGVLDTRKASRRAATEASNCWRRPYCPCSDPVCQHADACSCPPVTQPSLPQADATLLAWQSGSALRVAAARQPAWRAAPAWLFKPAPLQAWGPVATLGSAAPGRARLRHARAALRLLVPPAGPAQPLACAPAPPASSAQAPRPAQQSLIAAQHAVRHQWVVDRSGRLASVASSCSGHSATAHLHLPPGHPL